MFAKFAILLLPLALVSQFETNTLSGVVVAVHSGDSLTLKHDNRLLKVRLANIFAPTLSQPFGPQSKKYLESLALNRKVGVDIVLFDTYSRLVAEVTLADGRLANDEMVAAGLAWHYRVLRPPKPHLARLEYQAFSQKLGLWLQPNPVPPWEYLRERVIPPPPHDTHQVDYDRIFQYGLLGDPKTRTYQWPACENYAAGDFAGKQIFMSILDAESIGFRVSPDCPH